MRDGGGGLQLEQTRLEPKGVVERDEAHDDVPVPGEKGNCKKKEPRRQAQSGGGPPKQKKNVRIGPPWKEREDPKKKRSKKK